MANWPGSAPPAPETSPSIDRPLALAYALTGTPIVTAVPEPASITLFGTGLLLTGALIVRRRKG